MGGKPEGIGKPIHRKRGFPSCAAMGKAPRLVWVVEYDCLGTGASTRTPSVVGFSVDGLEGVFPAGMASSPSPMVMGGGVLFMAGYWICEQYALFTADLPSHDGDIRMGIIQPVGSQDEYPRHKKSKN